MIVAAHQPLYLPWLGYFDKMAKSDVFVLMDDLQYEAQNFQNRNRLKLAAGPAWVTVPLERAHRRERIYEKRISNRANEKQHWQRRTWATIQTHYRRAPYFARYAADLYDIYSYVWTSLVDLDIALIELARRWLRVEVPMVRASLIGLTGAKTERLIDLCRKLRARTYLSGVGGAATYLDVEQMARSGIRVIWQHFAHPIYAQRYGRFASHLAFVDMMFNCGERSRALLLDRAHPLHARAA